MDKPPLISVCIISGDEGLAPSLSGQPDEGKPILERLLLSLEKSQVGDEYVISWNGTKSDELNSITKRFGAKVFTRPWDSDFGAARQHSFEQATGIFRGFFDTDDVIDWPSGKFRKFVSDHSVHHLIVVPYNYEVTAGGHLKRSLMVNRFCRWDYGWSFAGKVHEELKPYRRGRVLATRDWSLPVLHFQVKADSLNRNVAILQGVLELDGPSFKTLRDLGVALASAHLKSQEAVAQAVAQLTAAIEIAPSLEDKFLVLDQLAALNIKNKRFDAAEANAQEMLKCLPRRREPHFILSHCSYESGDFEGTVDHYHLGDLAPDRQLLAVESPQRDVAARLLAGCAYLALGAKTVARKMLEQVYQDTNDLAIQRILERL